MGIKSKDIILLTIGLIGSFLLAFVLSPIKIDLIDSLYFINGMLALLILAIGWVIGVKNKELKEQLDNQKLKQQKLSEKLKIHEQLIDMKADIKELQKRILKNGKK